MSAFINIAVVIGAFFTLMAFVLFAAYKTGALHMTVQATVAKTDVPTQAPPQPAKSPTVPPTPTATTPALATPSVERKPTLDSLLSKYITVKPLTDTSSHFTHEGICTKCGWHTLQLDFDSALSLMRQHVQCHWRDVVLQLRDTAAAPAAPPTPNSVAVKGATK